MLVLVVGGSGMAGSEVVAELLRRGEQVRVLSRGVRPTPTGVAAVHGDLRTGEGLDAALAGVDVVVNAANSASLRRKASEQVQSEGTQRLLDAARRAATAHYVGLSIVGIAHAPGGYYAAKRAEERLVEQSPVPWSLLCATQFFELLDMMFSRAARLPVMPLPTGILLQPVEAVHAGVRLADLVEAGPSGRVPELGGPVREPLGDLATQWLRVRRLRRAMLPVPFPGKQGRQLRAGALCTAQPGPGPAFAQWLAGRTARVSTAP